MKTKYLNIAIMAAALAGFGQVAHAGVTTFDGLVAGSVSVDTQKRQLLTAHLDGLTWNNAYIMDGSSIVTGGYHNAVVSDGVVGHNNVAYNGDGNSMTISEGGAAFNFTGSAYFTAAWYNGLGLTIEGLRNGAVVHTYKDTLFAKAYSSTVPTGGQTKKNIEFDFNNIDTIRFSSVAGANATKAFGSNSGSQFAMDNFTASVSPVPEPAEWAMLLLGLPLILRFAKGQKSSLV